MTDLPTDYTDGPAPTGATTEYPATTSRGLNATHAQINTNTAAIASKADSSGGTLTSPKIVNGLQDAAGDWMLVFVPAGAGANYIGIFNASTGTHPGFYAGGSDTDINIPINPAGAGRITSGGSNVLTASSTDSPVTGKTFTGLATTDGIAAVNLPNGITNGNTSAQSQLVVSGTSYYIAGSNLNLPNPLKAGMAVGTRFRWRVAMAKTNAGTGAFAIEIRRGTNGTTADTADVSQSIGTQTAAVDSMWVDVEIVVTATGATGSYFWSIVPVTEAVTATGFGVATGPTGQFSGTVSSVALNTASLKFGLSFKATTGTPTITIPLVQASAINIC